MADPAYNRFQASGSESDLKDFVQSCCNDLPDGQLAIEFERIIPVPAEVKGNKKLTRDWKMEHWSTDWVGDFRTEKRTTTGLILRFGSAGGPPENIYRELGRRFPEIKFVANFAEGANDLAHFFSACRGEVVSAEREATDEDWEAATGESNEEAERAYEAASAAWKAQHPQPRQSKSITHPRFWIRHWRVRRARVGYPLYDVPHRNWERELPEAQARENFDYFMRVRLGRLAFFQNWLRNHFRVDASLTPAGIHSVNRWVDRFGGGLIGDQTNRASIFSGYEPRWEGPFAGYNVMVDLGIFMGEYIILRRPRLRWELDQGDPGKPASSQHKGYRRPCLAGFPHRWTKDVMQSGFACVADSRKASKIGENPRYPLNVTLRVVKSALYHARLPDGSDPIIFGDSSNEQL
jgi:hypothetical protein